MSSKIAQAQVTPVRQRTQYSCMAASMAMCLNALGYETTEDKVNEVMGAQPMRGAAWEQALACAQHYGCRATLTVPATLKQVKEWTDNGSPVMIAWNPEGRDWSHASLIYDITDGLDEVPDYAIVVGEGKGLYVWVADPNIPHPEKTVRIYHENDFYSKWYEKWPNYLVRRPACAIEREVTPEGRQVKASTKKASEITIDEAGTARDDEGNTWQVGPGLAGIYSMSNARRLGLLPNMRPQPTTTRQSAPEDWTDRAKKLFMALLADGHDDRALKFVQDNMFRTSVSPKQLSWFESLERRHHRVISDIPDHLNLSFGGGSVILNTTGLSARDQSQIEKYFTLTPWRGSEYLVKHKTATTSRTGDAMFILTAKDSIMAARPNERQTVTIKKEDLPEHRNETVRQMIDRGWGSGAHQTRERDVAKGWSRTPKYKERYDKESAERVATRYLKGED